MRLLPSCAALTLLASCSAFVDADLDRLGPQIDLGDACDQVESCDDAIACTNDFCDATNGRCVHEPDEELCGGGRCDVQDGCTGIEGPCDRDEDCVDPSGCGRGECRQDFCQFEPIDADGDGTARCAGDCDDLRADVAPGAAENCGDGADNDCDGAHDGDDPACQGGCGRDFSIVEAGEIEGEVDGDGARGSEICSSGRGPEVLVDLHVERESDLFVSTEGSEFDTIVWLQEGCDGAEIGCSDNRSLERGWLDSRLVILGIAPGDYTIGVDAVEQGGRFRLRVDRENPRRPSCERPLDVSDGGTVIGHTSGDSAEGASCSDPSGPEHVFRLDIDDFGPLTVSTEDSDFDVVQDLQLDECGGESEPGYCLDRTPAGELFESFVVGGRYMLVVDGFEGASGRYVLRVFP